METLINFVGKLQVNFKSFLYFFFFLRRFSIKFVKFVKYIRMILKIVFIYYSQAFVFWDTLSLVTKFLNSGNLCL